jgi:hypothetical protein
MTRTTFSTATSPQLAPLPYLHSREIDGLLDDIDSGALIALCANPTGGIGAGEIVALATPEIAEAIVNAISSVEAM